MQATQNFKQLLSLSTNKKVNPMVENLPIVRAITNFLALTKYHLKTHTIAETYTLLINDLQQLLITILVNPLPEDLQKQAVANYLLSSTNSEIYLDDLTNFVSEIDLAYISVIGRENIGKIISIDVLKTLSELNPHAHTHNILEHNKAALATNFGFLVAMMYNLNQINLTKNEKKELIYFLNEAVIRYGAYAMVLDFWQPDTHDTRQIIRSTEILASRIKLQTNQALPLTLEQLKEKLAA
jgi:hypothetical protein